MALAHGCELRELSCMRMPPAFVISSESNPMHALTMDELRRVGIHDVTVIEPVRDDAINAEVKRAKVGMHAQTPYARMGLTTGHSKAWRAIVRRKLPRALVFEDDVVLHREWAAQLACVVAAAHAAAAAGRAVHDDVDGGACGTSDARDGPLDAVLLDGLFMVGAASAEHGWLGPAAAEGPLRAIGVTFSSAYALTPAAARWLLARAADAPGRNAESYLLMLQEERGRCWTHLPRMAVQRWDEATSSVSELQPRAMRRWYEQNYFPRWPRSLYLFE